MPKAARPLSAKGGQLIGGHGLSRDHALRTGARLSELWDGLAIRRLRAGDGLTLLQGRRLSLHILVQPEAAAGFLSDPTLRDQGLLSRFLVAAPESLAGTRFSRDPCPQDEAIIGIAAIFASIFLFILGLVLAAPRIRIFGCCGQRKTTKTRQKIHRGWYRSRN